MPANGSTGPGGGLPGTGTACSPRRHRANVTTSAERAPGRYSHSETTQLSMTTGSRTTGKTAGSASEANQRAIANSRSTCPTDSGPSVTFASTPAATKRTTAFVPTRTTSPSPASNPCPATTARAAATARVAHTATSCPTTQTTATVARVTLTPAPILRWSLAVCPGC